MDVEIISLSSSEEDNFDAEIKKEKPDTESGCSVDFSHMFIEKSKNLSDKRKIEENSASLAKKLKNVHSGGASTSEVALSDRSIRSASCNKPVQNKIPTEAESSNKSNNSSRYTQSFRLTENNVSAEAIVSILNDSLEGRSILKEYKDKQLLTNSSRKKLVALIVNRCTLEIDSAVKFFFKVAVAITDHFKLENIDHYYIKAFSDGNNSKNPKGLLISKWRNLMTVLKKNQVISTLNKGPEKNKAVPLEATEEIKNRQKWLSRNREPWDFVKENWNATFAYRSSQLKCIDQNLMHFIDNEWPIFKSKLGPPLIELDFIQAYKNSRYAIEKNWEYFLNDLYSLRHNLITGSHGLILKEKFEKAVEEKDQETVDNLSVLLLPYLIPPTSRVAIGNKGSKKPSVRSSVEGLYVWSQTLDEAVSAIRRRAEYYKTFKQPVQPCLLFIGPKESYEIEQVYISMNKLLWRTKSGLHAFDILFKLLMVFDLEYQKDCEHFWVVVQHRVYGIHLKSDKKIPVSLCIEALLKNLADKRQK